jgi:peptidoglycan/xylan/chitin deacetylase (PgdA/CDA1 family)
MVIAADRAERRVSLTFDNGPAPGVTDAVLDLLARRALKATFFVVGDRLAAEGGTDLARRALSEGHRVGNHTATHTVLLGRADDPGAAVAVELAAPAERIAAVGGDPKLYRPYAAGGVLDHRVLNHAAVDYLVRHRCTCVLWNSVPHDWDDPEGWVDRAWADVDRQAWTVVVVHDLPTGAMDHLPRFLDGLEQRGVEMRTDFPEACLPIRRGRVCADLAPLMPEQQTVEQRPVEPTKETTP